MEHGFLPSFPKLPKEQPVSFERRREHNGYPVITEAQLGEGMNVDSKYFGNAATISFDFRGYYEKPKSEAGGVELAFADVMVARGLQSGTNHDGLFIQAMAVSSQEERRGLTNPDDPAEYEIHVAIPSQLQRERGVVCTSGHCVSEQEYQAKLLPWEDKPSPEELQQRKQEELEALKSSKDRGWVRIKLHLSASDAPTRAAVREIFHSLVASLEKEQIGLDKIEAHVKELALEQGKK